MKLINIKFHKDKKKSEKRIMPSSLVLDYQIQLDKFTEQLLRFVYEIANRKTKSVILEKIDKKIVDIRVGVEKMLALRKLVMMIIL